MSNELEEMHKDNITTCDNVDKIELLKKSIVTDLLNPSETNTPLLQESVILLD